MISRFAAPYDRGLSAIITRSARPWLGFEELAHQTFCRLGVSAPLNQHVKKKAILINNTPKPVFPNDSDDKLIEASFVSPSTS